ncbi:MAG: histidine kinase dimerization/phosphoacceptor domain -containing protein [Chitinophagaceae bacterium]
MLRYLLVLLFFFTIAFLPAQELRNPIPASYNADMQRLLVIATANFVYAICQGQLDRDSAVIFSSRTFGLSRLTAYNEGFSTGKDYPGGRLIDSGRIDLAIQQLASLQGDARQQLLAELGNYYLHKPGNDKLSIDSAGFFIEQLYRAANAAKDKWLPYSLWLMGGLNTEKNNPAKGDEYFAQATAYCRNAGDAKMLAIALLYQGGNLAPDNAKREDVMQEALAICKKEELPLLQYRVMIMLLLDHTHTQTGIVAKELKEALEFEKKIGFLHHQYAYNSLAYWHTLLGDLVQAKLNAEHALESMVHTKDTVFSTVYSMRMSETYSNLQNMPPAMYWNTRALSVQKTKQTQVFWFKSMLDRIRMLNKMGRYSESLEFAKEVKRLYPPQNDFDKMHLLFNIGCCYEELHKDEEALDYYLQFLEIAERFPPQFAYADMLLAYGAVADFYFRKKNYETARKFTLKILDNPIGKVTVPYEGMANYLLFRLDSVEGNYVSAIQHYQLYHQFRDSTYSLSQRKKMDELTVQYETKKKDQDISILKKDGLLQQEKLSRTAIMGKITLAGIVVLLIIVGLLYNQYRLKQRSNKETLARNETLQQLVEEKEWLLREVHHRVKNNLQTIVSLLESQSTYLQNEALLAIQESQNRIHAMSLIHQKLYHNENISSVNMGDYLPELVQYLFESYDVRNKILLDVEVEGTELDVSQAIPVGLIVNEVLTNAIKYAFPVPQVDNRVTVSFLTKKDGVATLRIADNGTGIAPEILNSKVKGLGLKLIRGLAKDIDADLELQAGNGTCVVISFKVSRTLKSIAEESAINTVNV